MPTTEAPTQKLATKEDIIRAVQGLPETDQMDLLDELWALTARPGDFMFAEEWRAEIQRRTAEADAGRVAFSPWEDVIERVRNRNRGNG